MGALMQVMGDSILYGGDMRGGVNTIEYGLSMGYKV